MTEERSTQRDIASATIFPIRHWPDETLSSSSWRQLSSRRNPTRPTILLWVRFLIALSVRSVSGSVQKNAFGCFQPHKIKFVNHVLLKFAKKIAFSCILCKLLNFVLLKFTIFSEILFFYSSCLKHRV